MSALIDTHTFLWMVSEEGRLGVAAREYLADVGNPLLLSIASGWEIAIKAGRGRLELRLPLEELLTQVVRRFSLKYLPLKPRHLVKVAARPDFHRDPFDRLLIAQCLVEDIPLVSADDQLDAYGIRRIW